MLHAESIETILNPLMKLLTHLVLPLVLASPLLAYPRYNNAASRALAKEAALIAKGDTPEAARRYAIGDNPENQDYWTGKKPLPAARVTDLLQLSLVAGCTTEDEWFTSQDGKVIVFMAEPGCGASNRVFTVFRLNRNNEYQRVGQYNVWARYVEYLPAGVEVTEHQLTVTYISKPHGLKIEKTFHFADNEEESCRLFSEIDSESDMGKRRKVNRSSDYFYRKQPNHGSGSQLARAAAHQGGAFDNLESNQNWKDKATITDFEIEHLYHSAREIDGICNWIADEKDETFALLEWTAAGCWSYTLHVYRAIPGGKIKRWRYQGRYTICSRIMEWDVTQTRFDADGIYVELVDRNGKHRKGHKFLYTKSSESFDYLTDVNAKCP